MFEQEISLPCTLEWEMAVPLVESVCQELGLTMTLKDGLRSYPGAIHWHFKQGKATGVLEITFWPQQNRLWLSVHRNRMAKWIEICLPELQKELVAGLREGCTQDG